MNNKDRLTKELLALWLACIGGSHHKPRDCLFNIIKAYSCYDKIEYIVEHHGYILHYVPVYSSFKTLEEAEQYLIDLLRRGISGELASAMDDSDEVFSELPPEKAREIKLSLDALGLPPLREAHPNE